MKENILIIGFGDIGQRVVANLNHEKYNFISVSRSSNINIADTTHIQWDWLSEKKLKLPITNFKRIIFIPKPSEMSETGYQQGFKNAAKNVVASLGDIDFESFIAVSSTRVFGSEQIGILDEDTPVMPDCFRGLIISKYEEFLKENISRNLNILRFGGLYIPGASIPKFNNKLSRDRASKIICFFITNIINGVFHCTENKILDPKARSLKGKKLLTLGFND